MNVITNPVTGHQDDSTDIYPATQYFKLTSSSTSFHELLDAMSDNVEPTETLVSLRSSLSEVEETLKPLLERKWTETTASLGTLERAKMDVLVSYAINDLIWGEDH